MAQAIRLAGLHRPHPNPRVGAVLVSPSGEMLGSGGHARPGAPHAEWVALAEAGDLPEGSTMVVTLEPCDHHGRTPPCTEALIDAGVARVVVGVLDPDERVSGSGVDRLRAAGIDVAVLDAGDPLAAQIVDTDPGYFHHRRTGRARVLLKLASTLDGQTAAADGTSQWITGAEARRDAHRLRAATDAVLVGAGTVIADDPRLDVRLEGFDVDPRPVILAGTRDLPGAARIWQRDPIVVSSEPRSVPSGENLVTGGEDGRVDLAAMLRQLPDLGILDVLVEGGASVAAALWAASLVDRGVTYLGSAVAGGVGRALFDATFETLDDMRSVRILDVRRVGQDLRVDWEPADQGEDRPRR